MKQYKFSVILALMLSVLVACNKTDSTSTPAPAAGTSTSDAAPAATAPAGSAIALVDTQEGKPLVIDAALFDTPAAKEFLATGKNPYIGNAEAGVLVEAVLLHATSTDSINAKITLNLYCFTNISPKTISPKTNLLKKIKNGCYNYTAAACFCYFF